MDTLDKSILRKVSRKGKKLIGRRPDRIYRTMHGFHCIWDNVQRYGRDITEEEMLSLRERLKDDRNRIRLDSETNRQKQILFSQKRVKMKDNEGNIIKDVTYERRRIR